MARSTHHGVQLFSLLAMVLLLAGPDAVSADDITVRFHEGVTHGFLVVSDDAGKKVGDGDLQQIVQGDRVNNHLLIRFKDGSRYDDSTVFTQHGVFHLLTDHLIEQGPSFKNSIETQIDASSGQVTIRYRDDHGEKKTILKQMDLPPDLANGLLYVLVKDLKPGFGPTTVSYLVATPQPRLVKLVFTRQGKNAFATGGVRRDADHFVMHVDIGGLTGVVARLFGKQPPDTDLWVIGGDAPALAGTRGPLDGNGPVWKISLVSPVSLDETAAVSH